MRRPVFIAAQARHAHGWLGHLIAFVMARETWTQNQQAIEALAVKPGDRVLDVGCGPGRSIGALASLAFAGEVVGVDPSALMAEVAVRRNRSFVNSGRARIVIAGAAQLPFDDATFDKVLCVHVLYFWEDLEATFREIARVMKSGGSLALLFRTNADTKAVNAFPAAVYRFPALADDGAARGRGIHRRTAQQAREAIRARLLCSSWLTGANAPRHHRQVRRQRTENDRHFRSGRAK